MKRKLFTQSAFFSLRSFIALLLCAAIAYFILSPIKSGLAFLHAPSNGSQRTLTFEERVSYQRAIEDVYWRHRIWPKDRPDSKPSLEAMMSQAQLEKKVTDYLRKSQMLEDHWQRPITADQLQTEMDRMAHQTKQPEVLQELFEVLGNDPFVIAECLARPTLAGRLFRSPQELEARAKANLLTDSHEIHRKPFIGYSLPQLATISEAESGCSNDTWTPTNAASAPTGRYEHTAIWTGSEMIVWGGEVASTFATNTGGRYNPTLDTWIATSTTNAPDARESHTAVWTGSEMIVWGGWYSDGFIHILNTGGRYNPITDSWTSTSMINVPDPRRFHTAIWTGTEMIVWGGEFDDFLNTGGRYNPQTDSWIATSTTNAPDAREFHTAVWTGDEMIIWGGYPPYLNTGGRYNPTTDTWTATSTANPPQERSGHIAVWTGNEMIVWGGFDFPEYVPAGGRYNPDTDTWIAISTANSPLARSGHKAIWSGNEMIVWGGYNEHMGGFLNTGGRYNPSTDDWTVTSMVNVPSPRELPSAVWNRAQMIVWGGYDGNSLLSTGGRYCAPGRVTPRPRPTPHPRPTPP